MDAPFLLFSFSLFLVAFAAWLYARRVTAHAWRNAIAARRYRADLVQSEEQYRILFEGNPLPVWVFDARSLRFLEVNDAATVQYGYSRQEFLRMTILDIRLPEDVQDVKDLFARDLPPYFHAGVGKHRRKDGSLILVDVITHALQFRGSPARMVLAIDVTERRRVEEELKTRARQQEAVTRIGQYALSGPSLQALFDRVASLVTNTIGARFSCVLSLARDAENFTWETGTGWNGPLPGTRISAAPDNQFGYALLSNEPVVVNDQESETRFSALPLPERDGIRSGVVVVIHGPERPYGVLSVHCERPRHFSDNDVHFLQAVAHVLSTVVERKKAEERMESSLREKEVLLKEIHHRVKNNLQVISSLLSLQSDYIEDKMALSMFRNSQNRIRSMALVHQKLYQSNDMARVHMGEYLQSLIPGLRRSYAVSDGVVFRIETEEVYLGVDTAIPAALIVNELVANALEHAFRGRDKGEILVQLRHDPARRLTLTVADDGVGLPASVDVFNTSSLGLKLVSALADQLRAELEVERRGGTRFTLRMPKADYARAEA